MTVTSPALQWNEKKNSVNMKHFRNAVSPVQAVKSHRNHILCNVLFKTRSILRRTIRVAFSPLQDEENEHEKLEKKTTLKHLENLRDDIETIEWTSMWIEDNSYFSS